MDSGRTKHSTLTPQTLVCGFKKQTKRTFWSRKRGLFSNTDFSLIKAANCLFLTRFYQNQKVLVLGHAEKEECIYWTEW